jgi:hypothetical protein
LSGEKQIIVPSESVNPTPRQPGDSGLSFSYGRDVVPELRLHDVLRQRSHKFFCFTDGQVFVHLRAPYYCRVSNDKDAPPLPLPHAPTKTCSEFHGMYDPDPYSRPRRI